MSLGGAALHAGHEARPGHQPPQHLRPGVARPAAAEGPRPGPRRGRGAHVRDEAHLRREGGPEWAGAPGDRVAGVADAPDGVAAEPRA